MQTTNHISRRRFLAATGAIAGTSLLNPVSQLGAKTVTSSTVKAGKLKLAIVGTGGRGCGMWGSDLTKRYPEQIEFVGLCDSNPGRVETGRKIIGSNCPVYSDSKQPLTAFEKMMKETKPDLLIVTTVDNTHHEYIVRGMELGVDVLTEKPMTTDEKKVQAILDAEKRTGKKCRVTFNYRYSPHRVKMWELLRAGEIGELTSVDFHWYLDTSHGADYFRRWHRLMEKSGSLWLHKASHHFDLLNWWIDSDPETVFALGSLDFYGKNGTFRGENCRTCPHTGKCQFYWNINKPVMTAAMADAMGTGTQTVSTAKRSLIQQLYVDNEQYDGYLRDGCVFKNDIDIFDKMAATIRYKNGVQVSYSLTAYSPYEGYRIAFNGTKGRIDAWIQESKPVQDVDYDEIVLFRNFSKRQYITIPNSAAGHGGGDNLLRDQLFLPNIPDPYKQCAGSRDGALACLVGIAARHSIASGLPVKIADLTSLKPQTEKQYVRI
ncbi:MAG: Gfo/Idh/MocA family oxidoreductase [Dysgonamonadaceae bacterium]|jgi:predicted dehydrogenase|nr:Gfo/Idh/MocA family oxidoreductase [Dysgonamonadaceae bacterium]